MRTSRERNPFAALTPSVPAPLRRINVLPVSPNTVTLDGGLNTRRGKQRRIQTVNDLFSNAVRRDPYQVYDLLRAGAPLSRDPASGIWLALGYDVVKQVLSDSELFSSRYGPDWMLFADPPPAHKASGPCLQGVHAPDGRRPRAPDPGPVRRTSRSDRRTRRDGSGRGCADMTVPTISRPPVRSTITERDQALRTT